MKCDRCEQTNIERVYKTPNERLKNYFFPGKAYTCHHCGKHVYKHTFPYISWPILTIVAIFVGFTLIM